MLNSLGMLMLFSHQVTHSGPQLRPFIKLLGWVPVPCVFVFMCIVGIFKQEIEKAPVYFSRPLSLLLDSMPNYHLSVRP